MPRSKKGKRGGNSSSKGEFNTSLLQTTQTWSHDKISPSNSFVFSSSDISLKQDRRNVTCIIANTCVHIIGCF